MLARSICYFVVDTVFIEVHYLSYYVIMACTSMYFFLRTENFQVLCMWFFETVFSRKADAVNQDRIALNFKQDSEAAILPTLASFQKPEVYKFIVPKEAVIRKVAKFCPVSILKEPLNQSYVVWFLCRLSPKMCGVYITLWKKKPSSV